LNNREEIRAEQGSRVPEQGKISQEQGRATRRSFDRHVKERGGFSDPSGWHNATFRLEVESYVDGLLLQGSRPIKARIACDHMSGLLLRSRMTAGQDGIRDEGSKQRSDL